MPLRDRSKGFAARTVARAVCWYLFLGGCLASATARAQPATEPGFHPPDVSDVMLAPAPAAPQQVKTWDDAIALLRAHSPDYASSYESVKRAEAQSRIALAAVLPVLSAQGSYVHQFFIETVALGRPPAPSFIAPLPDTFAATKAILTRLGVTPECGGASSAPIRSTRYFRI